MYGDMYIGEGRYVRSVNGVRPDASGDVTVSGGGGGSYTFTGQDGIAASESGGTVTIRLLDLVSYRTTGNGSSLAYTVPGGAVATIEEVLVGEVAQSEGTHWTWSGNTVTFSTAPENSAEITIRYRR